MSSPNPSTGQCSRCGKPLPVNVLSGHCPQCLLEVSFGILSADTRTEGLPRAFGDYQLIAEIARGGMGVVYRARDNKLKRTVALKLVLAGQFASRAAIDRFRSEAEAAAALQHPNIITIYEVGETEGQPYFTMELIEGSTLTDLVRSGPLPPARAAKYVETIAHAVAFAHERGILHRDLKPSNVLVDPFDQPRITDFGLAKQVRENSQLTVTGQQLGSPAYMAPEQVSTQHGRVSAASDVYSLGAVLYHLITGRAPFAAGTVAETLQQALNNEALPPRALNPHVPLDLQTICLKCLEKEPRRRYQSAAAVAEELRRYLRDEPILARPISWSESAWRWCRRKPVVAGLAVTVASLALMLLVGTALAAWRIEKARRAENGERQKAVQANAELQQANTKLADTITVLELERVESLFRAGDSSMALARLANVLRRDPSNSIVTARIVSSLLYRNWVLPSSRPLEHPGNVSCLAVSSSGRYFVTGCTDGYVRVWDQKDHRQVGQSLRHPSPVRDVAFTLDEASLASGAQDGDLRIWDWRTGQLKASPIKHPGWVFSVSFSPDGERIVTACDDSIVRVWGTHTGELLLSLSGHRWAVRKAEFSPDGKIIATAGYDAMARLWDSGTGKFLMSPLKHGDGPVLGVAFSPDGNLLATACRDRTARVWDVQTGTQAIPALAHPGGLNDVAFDPTGRFLATSSYDNTVRIWDTESGQLVSQPFRHAEQVNTAVFMFDAQTLATGGDDRLLKFWDVRPSQALSEPMGHQNNLTDACFSSSGDLIATASIDGTARIWNANTGLPQTAPLAHTGFVYSVCFRPDSRFLATASAELSPAIWEVGTGKRLPKLFPHTAAVRSASFSPDGKRLVTASADQTARVWDFESGKPVTPPLTHKGEVIAAQFSPDGTRVLTASNDGTARVWDATTGLPITPSLVHSDVVHCAVFSPDGHRVATASADNTARVWDARTGEPIGRAMAHLRSVRTVGFSPDGLRVVTASLDCTARVWDAFTGEPLTAPIRHDDAVSCACFSPDGGQILTGSADYSTRVWDAKTGLPLSELLRQKGPVIAARFSPDGRQVVSAATFPEDAAHRWLNPVVPSLAPDWLPKLAEAAAGISIATQGTTQLISENEFEGIRRRVTALTDSSDLSRVAGWFFADRSTRTISPFDNATVQEYVQDRIEENTTLRLEEAIRLQPTNALALGRLAGLIKSTDSSPRGRADAMNLARRALQFIPDQSEARNVLAGGESHSAPRTGN